MGGGCTAGQANRHNGFCHAAGEAGISARDWATQLKSSANDRGVCGGEKASGRWLLSWREQHVRAMEVKEGVGA
jgi:hypothetical protein